jgi:TonB family protein
LGQIRYCYERQLSASPDLYGKVAVKFVIGAAGEVTSQQIGSSTLKNAMVEGCILRRVARWKFPNPKGGTSVIVTYPFLFKSLN